MSANIGSAVAQGLLGLVSNVPVFGAMFKPLTDALSGLFGGQQGAGNVRSIMADYDNGTADAGQLFNAVNNGLDGSVASDNGGPADKLRAFMASSKDGQPIEGDKLMQLLRSLDRGAGNPGQNIVTGAGTGAGQGQRAISF